MSILGFLILILVAAIIGFIADALVPGTIPFGWLAAIIIGLIGAYVGTSLFGAIGPAIAGIYILPAIVGAVILVILLELLLGAFYPKRV